MLWQLRASSKKDLERRPGESRGKTRFRPGSVQHSAWHRLGRAGQHYVGDRGNNRIQVYDTNMNFKKSSPA